MLKKISFIALFMMAAIFVSNAPAQTVGEATIAVNNSKLTMINLPDGARRIKDGFYPPEVTTVLAKFIAQGGAKVRQGESEALVFGGNYQKGKGKDLIKKFESDLQAVGWTYEFAAKAEGVTIFTLLRDVPERRGLIGFFAPSKEGFIFAVTEMLPAN